MLAYKVATQPRAHQSAYADTFYCSAQSASVFMQTFATAQPRARRSASEAVAKQGSRYRVHASLLILYTCLYFILDYTLYLPILYTCLRVRCAHEQVCKQAQWYLSTQEATAAKAQAAQFAAKAAQFAHQLQETICINV